MRVARLSDIHGNSIALDSVIGAVEHLNHPGRGYVIKHHRREV